MNKEEKKDKTEESVRQGGAAGRGKTWKVEEKERKSNEDVHRDSG